MTMVTKHNIKVTVTMPAYNASRFIKEAIESILSQDYGKFELLIIDDASKDNTLKIIREYKNHPKVRFYVNKENLGVGTTRNRMLRLARGEYISPCDADDIMLPGNLKTLSRYLDTHPNIGVAYGDILVIERDERGKVTEPPVVLGKDCNRSWDLIEDNPLINHPGSMIRKSLMLKVGGYGEAVYCIDDWALWLKLAGITQFKYLQGVILYIWRRHPKSLTRTVTAERLRSDIFKIKKEAIWRRYNIDFKV